jgi:hypothetical protein
MAGVVTESFASSDADLKTNPAALRPSVRVCIMRINRSLDLPGTLLTFRQRRGTPIKPKTSVPNGPNYQMKSCRNYFRVKGIESRNETKIKA